MRLIITDQENNMMQVSMDGVFYEGLDGTQLADNVHAVQWYDTHGEVEYKDPTTDKMTHNVEIDSIADFQFAIDAWNAAKAAEEAAEEAAIALQEAKSQAFKSAYNQAIADGDSEEDAIAAGQAASDAVTDAPE